MHWENVGGVICPGICVSVLFLFAASCSSPLNVPEPPGGGQVYMLDYNEYQTVVAPIIAVHGCAAEGNCHGGGIRGTLELSPVGDKDLQYDFEQISLQVDGVSPQQSALLLKPLAEAAGGAPHSYEGFDSVTHTDYQALLTWIENGSFQ